MSTPDLRTVAVTTHGRYLVARPAGDPAGLLVGFHGYAETADVHLDALRVIDGTAAWLIVAVQALHPFYTRDGRIVASWMTAQDRELAISDNIQYVRTILDAVDPMRRIRPLVFIGFSQGGAMAYRAAAHCAGDAVIVLAADVPPDLSTTGAPPLPPVLLGRGTEDTWYTADQHAADVATLSARGVSVESCVFPGGHEWGVEFRDAVTRRLRTLAA